MNLLSISVNSESVNDTENKDAPFDTDDNLDFASIYSSNVFSIMQKDFEVFNRFKSFYKYKMHAFTEYQSTTNLLSPIQPKRSNKISIIVSFYSP
jgi:hypothetical protein